MVLEGGRIKTENPFALPTSITISPSLLSLYEKCKYAIYHRLTHRWTRLPERVTRGIKVHERLEEVIKGEVTPTFQELQILRFLEDLGYQFDTEQFIRLSINGIEYIGKYDVLVNKGNIIVDFKVPSKPNLPRKLPKWYIESYQQIIYQRIIYELTHSKPTFILVFYDPQGVSKVFRWFELPFIGISHWEKVEKTAQKLLHDFQNRIFTPNPEECSRCLYRFTCPYASVT